MSQAMAPLAEAAAWSLADAFPAAFESEQSYLCHSLRRLGVPPAHVEDVAQEVFLKAFQCFGSYDPARPLRPWLFGIAVRIAANFRRQASLKYEEAGELPDVATDGRTPEEEVAAQRARQLLMRVLEPLDEDKRAVFVLHEIDGLSIPEAAEVLGVPVNTAYTRLRAARHRFAEELRRVQGGGAT